MLAPPKYLPVLFKWLELLVANAAPASPVVTALLAWLRTACRQSVSLFYPFHPQTLPPTAVAALYALQCDVAVHGAVPVELLLPVVKRVVGVMATEAVEADAFTDELAVNAENAPAVARLVIGAFQALLKPLGALAGSCKYYQVKEAVEQERVHHLVSAYYTEWRCRAMRLVSALQMALEGFLPLIQASPPVSIAETLLSLVKDFYGVVDQTMKQIAFAGDDCPIQMVTKLTEAVCSRLTPTVYSLIHLVQRPGSKDIHLKKQAKLVPELIYTIEQYEATLIQVNKKTKGNVNLTMFIKRSTARDFRIDGEKLSRKMERREQNEEEKELKRRKDEEPQFCVC